MVCVSEINVQILTIIFLKLNFPIDIASLQLAFIMLEQGLSIFEVGNGDYPNAFVADSGMVLYVALELGIFCYFVLTETLRYVSIELRIRHSIRAYILLKISTS